MLRKQAIEARTAATKLQTAVDVLQGVLRATPARMLPVPGGSPDARPRSRMPALRRISSRARSSSSMSGSTQTPASLATAHSRS